ncbi:MAG TPA: hypothetical protein VL993_01380 [Stellaceae bacterium]|nr:hypothetical protein [Stellaceae bacterium]
MKPEALLAVAVGMMLFAAAGTAKAADDGTVRSLSDLDSGAANYLYIDPHAGFDNLPPNAWTRVSPVRPAPQSEPRPPQSDVPIDPAASGAASVTPTYTAHWR